MKHIKELDQNELTPLQKDPAGVGLGGEKAIITFGGVIPNGDPENPGYWPMFIRQIVIPFPYPISKMEDKEERVMEALRKGSFEVEVDGEDDERYIGSALDKDNIISKAKEPITYKRFYDSIKRDLYNVGYQVYVEDHGTQDEEELESLWSSSECPIDNNGVNEEAFIELLNLDSKSDLTFEEMN